MTNTANVNPQVVPFFESHTNTFSYIVKDPHSAACVVIDSLLNFDYASGQISYESADEIIQYVKAHQLQVVYLIETHVHADHLSAAPYIQSAVGGEIAIGEHIHLVQEQFGTLFNEGTEFQRDGSQFDLLFKDGQQYAIGSLQAKALHTPGHTPACMVHVIGDAAFVGDTLFMPDGGTARADFPGGDARTLYQSIQKILALPDKTRLFMCHDYQPNGRELRHESSVLEQRQHNIHIGAGVAERDFVVMREARDKTLGMPKLIYPSLQTNMRAGHFPPQEGSGAVFLKVPIFGINASLKSNP